ncbi:molecular chaperone [Erythrobacter sp. sf7]|uniref:Molecular chaperone n=1 Tax=Erythrobacter fulvus TaxID=2987523 RepID=A0ABT5JNJ0_9SPHN|nr:ATP12 family protein [Erythrobacter fulvus]MDC8754336.1 molecular chaperone [Erythrobacter fulvus]
MRRFYKDVTLGEVPGAQTLGYQVLLDGRGVKTVGGAAQLVPTQGLGEALAAEWRRQGEKIDPKSLPLRDMADYAIDVVASDPVTIAAGLIAYAETDTLCYRADPDEPLHARQQAVWEPLLSAFEAAHGITLVRVSGVLHRPQPPETLATLQTKLTTLDPFALAGVEAMTKLAASLVTALAALDAADGEEPLALWQAACLEEEWQAELWGRDEEAEERRARREADFLRACGFARLARC